MNEEIARGSLRYSLWHMKIGTELHAYPRGIRKINGGSWMQRFVTSGGGEYMFVESFVEKRDRARSTQIRILLLEMLYKDIIDK